MCIEGKSMTTEKIWKPSKCSSRISEERENNHEDSTEIPKVKRKLSGHKYKELVRLPAKKAKGSELSIQEESKMSESDENVIQGVICDKIETTNAESLSNSTHERVDFVLKRIKYSDHEEESNSHDTQTNEKHFSSEFVEYWVPVRLSNLQTEQYCGALFSNKDLLSSYFKRHHLAAEVLPDLLNSTRKCCDHPYLVSQTLRDSVRRSTPEHEKFHGEIKLSSKLDLLYKTLLEIKKRGLRVLILFQSLGGSGSIKLGDILDDILYEEFGADSYARIHGDISLSKQQDAHIKKFAFLIEKRACIPSLEIPPIDTVIIFNSDLDPMNDLKALQKFKIKPELKIFRFYSCCTVEEKVLILAKEGMTLEGNVKNFKKQTYHGLLSWGAHYLFSKLDEFHEVENQDSFFIDSSGESFMNEVSHEMSRLLPNDPEGGDCKRNSHIVEAKQIGRIYYTNISLPGELESSPVENEPAHAFWANLFEGRKPRWKHFSTRLSRTRKRFRYFYDGQKANEKCWKETRAVVDQIPTNIKRRKRNKRKVQQNKERNIPETTVRRKKSIVQSSSSSSQPEISQGVDNILPSDQMHPIEQDHTPASNATLPPTEDLILPKNIKRRKRNKRQDQQNKEGKIPETTRRRRKRNKYQDQQNTERNIPETSRRRKKAIVQSGSSSQPEISRGVNNILPSDQMHPIEQDHATASNVELPPVEDLILPSQVSMQNFGGNQSSCSVIEMELERLQKERDQIPKIREDAIQEIKSAYEKEIADIRKKYDMLLQNAETSFLEKTGALENRCGKMKKNKALADAIVQKNIQETAANSSQESLLDELCQLLLLESRASVTRPEQLHEYPSTSALIPHAPPGFSPPSSLVQTSNRETTLGLNSSNQLSLVQTSNRATTVGLSSANHVPMLCLEPVYGMRAPAPHLKHNRQFRPQMVTCYQQTQGIRVDSQQFPHNFGSGAEQLYPL